MNDYPELMIIDCSILFSGDFLGSLLIFYL